MRASGPLRSHLKSQGTPIGSMDTLIAAHCPAVHATRVINHAREFQRVPGLALENRVDTSSA
jgi:tRNA(fMet)-specific endonuclease VapC